MKESLHGSSKQTATSLTQLQERLAAIDKAQDNITKLSGDVLSLQDILSNKQTRGAFGEIQLNDIVSKALPSDSFQLQATLSNGRRADCLINLPNPPGPIVIDSKFPLEAYEALIASTNDAELKAAVQMFRSTVRKHINDISEKYILDGETADGALMFLPSEAVYAELHAKFPELVQESFSKRVWIVSPTTCMATLNTMRAILKDARMREQAGRNPQGTGPAAQGCGTSGRPGVQSGPAFRTGGQGYLGNQDQRGKGGPQGAAAGQFRFRRTGPRRSHKRGSVWARPKARAYWIDRSRLYPTVFPESRSLPIR